MIKAWRIAVPSSACQEEQQLAHLMKLGNGPFRNRARTKGTSKLCYNDFQGGSYERICFESSVRAQSYIPVVLVDEFCHKRAIKLIRIGTVALDQPKQQCLCLGTAAAAPALCQLSFGGAHVVQGLQEGIPGVCRGGTGWHSGCQQGQ